MDSSTRTWTRRVVCDGLLLSVVFSAIMLGTGLIDPWLLLENYPPAIRELVTPPDDRSGPRIVDSVLSEISTGFQAAVFTATCSKYTASGVRRSSAV